MCPPGLEYRACGPACHQSCTNIGENPDPLCDQLACVEGCYCPEGEYLHGKYRYPNTLYTSGQVLINIK